MHRRTFALLPLLGFASLCGAASSKRLVVAVELSLLSQSADWMAKEVATPFERSFANLQGLTSMKSMSSASRCLIELGYAGRPSEDALVEAQSVSRATWSALEVSMPEPLVSIREAQLA